MNRVADFKCSSLPRFICLPAWCGLEKEIHWAAVENHIYMNRAGRADFAGAEPFGRIRYQGVKNQNILAFQQISAIKTKMKKDNRHSFVVFIAKTVSIHQKM